ncbi:MAG: ABC transporter substrate-binding protein [Desulfoplanes sp.]
MKFNQKMSVIIACIVILTAGFGHALAGSRPEIRFGTLPVLQALPVFVAAEKGYFTEQGINVSLIPFSSALEKDVALTAGEISGYFGDMMTAMMLNANRVPIRIIATIFNATSDQRLFGIVTAPGASLRTLHELAAAGIAGSSNTIIDYITTRILESQGIDTRTFNLIEAKRIPIRLQMLLSGQIPAATLPEPLLTLAVSKGGRVVADDAGKGISAIILAFRTDVLTAYPDDIRKFMVAISKAADTINREPESVRSIMIRYCRIPKSLEKTYPVPVIPDIVLPDSRQVQDVYRWLNDKKLIHETRVCKRIVSDGYLP